MSESIGAGSPASSRTAANERVVAIESLDWLRSLEGAWHRLLLASPTATAFASPAWVLTWYEHFQPRGGVYAVTVWRDGELVGLAPFARTRLGGARAGFTLLVSAGTEHGDYGDPLLGPDPVPVAAAIADHLVHLVHHEDTAVNLRRLREDDPLLGMLEARDDVACVPMGRRAENRIVRFTDLGAPEALDRLARKRDLPRRRRKLEEAHGEISFAASVDDVPGALLRMQDFLARRWAPGEGPRVFAGPGRAAFTHDVVTALVRSGLGRVTTLSVGGRVVGVTVDHRVGDREVGDLCSYDPDLRPYSVGLLHLHEVLVHAMRDGVTELDLRAGDFPYKDRWATEVRPTRSIALVAPGRRGRAQMAARRVAMSLRARRLAHLEHAPPPVRG